VTEWTESQARHACTTAISFVNDVVGGNNYVSHSPMARQHVQHFVRAVSFGSPSLSTIRLT
jgi:hypothetical protein